jgi:hypothetical protein
VKTAFVLLVRVYRSYAVKYSRFKKYTQFFFLFQCQEYKYRISKDKLGAPVVSDLALSLSDRPVADTARKAHICLAAFHADHINAHPQVFTEPTGQEPGPIGLQQQ